MKKFKVISIAILSSICIVVLAQTVSDVNSSVGNGDAMKCNLNEPNAINPAMDNIQGYERKGGKLEKCEQPEKDMANKYNRSYFQEKSK